MKAAAIACVIAAWLMFLASFALPATTAATGWEVMISAWPLAGLAAYGLFVGGLCVEPGLLLWVLMISLGNALMLVTPTFIFSLRGNAWILTPPSIVSAVIPWLAPGALPSNVRIGYYIWDASFFLMAIGSLLLTAAENRARWMLLTSPAREMELQFLLKNRMLESPGADDTLAGTGEDKVSPS